MAYGIAAAAAARRRAQMARTKQTKQSKRKADDGDSPDVKRRKTEKAELERLKKELEDYVAANEAHRGTERYEAEVAKRKKAYDDFYAGTLRGKSAAGRTRQSEAALDAAAKAYAALETARTALNSRTASRGRDITRLEAELAAARRLLTPKSSTDLAERTRTDATKNVRTLTTQLRALERRGATDAAHKEDVAKTRKVLEKAERRVARLRANAESLNVLEEFRIRLRVVKLSGKGGPAFRRDVEAAEKALATFRLRAKQIDKTDETATLRAMVEKFETSTRGGGQLLEAVNEAAVVVASKNGRREKEVCRSEANKDVDQAETQVADLKRRLSSGDDVMDEVEAAEADLERAKKRKTGLEAREARAAVADEFSRELEEWRTSKRGFTAFRHVHADAVRLVAKFRGLGRLDTSEQEEAVRAMLDVLKTTSGTGSVAICAQAVTDAREAMAPSRNSHSGSTFIKYVEETLGQQISSRDWERTFEDVLAQQPKDIGRTAAGCRSRTAMAALRDRVDALSLTGLPKATRAQKNSMQTLINTLGDAFSKLEGNYRAISDGKLEAMVEKVREAYDAVRWPKFKLKAFAPFRSFKASAKEARVALEVAYALRKCRLNVERKYNEEIEREAELCKQALDALKRRPRRSQKYTRELEAAQKAYDDAWSKTGRGQRAKFFEALLRAEAGTREVLPDEVYDEGREMADECNAHNDGEIEDGWIVYVGVAGSRNVKAEIAAALKRDSFTVKRKDGRPLLESQIRVKKWRTSSKVAALLAEKLSQDDTANAHTLYDIAYHLCGAGTLAHTAGDSFLYSISVKPGPDDNHWRSKYKLGRGVRFSPTFAAELRAATAPPDSMPDHADGDLNVRMRHDHRAKTPTYHVYTRGAWCVFSWKKDENLRTVHEQRRLWTSATEARKFAQKKIDKKTAARHRDGPYTVLSTA